MFLRLAPSCLNYNYYTWKIFVLHLKVKNETNHDTIKLVMPLPPLLSQKAHVTHDNHCTKSTLMIGSGDWFMAGKKKEKSILESNKEILKQILLLLSSSTSFSWFVAFPLSPLFPLMVLVSPLRRRHVGSHVVCVPPPTTDRVSPQSFSYFLFNAVTYGPVLYLLSAMQL